MITLAELTGLNTRSFFSRPPGLTAPAPPHAAPASVAPDPEPVRSRTFTPCRKRAYPDALAAEAQRVLLLSMPNCKDPDTLIIYVCHNCRHWHVGHDKHEKIRIPDQARPRIGRVR